MSEQALIGESPATATSAPEPRIGNEMVEFLSVIQQTPREYWPNLLKMMRLFLETVTVKPGLSEPAETPENVDFTKLSKERSIRRNQAMTRLIRAGLKEGNEDNEQPETIDPVQQHEALSKLLQSWVDDGDEQEQTETAEVLCKALEENSVHI
ncbi:MAG: hypothetical protein JGK17_10460 [Microcoleus sp. PH2017_10_PVI_O_A]|uniref:hypothetical protein n=1 Tax=unclassified Microcoleus TaxID=2642155 RepID=UPI001D538C28|nr:MULTISPECIES: hypothetical protein [unclassified Microcoleus]TAE93565.1 MAG: hypothetical protein EAZ79_26990 [Oscillatoriales cyanobacterium]MCC3405995.1 hypothetical protein [Microcoleus sp. PH2017_10_PVI_O_A]MCC3460024.1 hypothetical protein [Microcoleus sp. PH2017_11_PCY_U_A]MCC3478524.1 hypothetical protein [Microcoleus sp. PH2017_12_PCY_D_A]MCC3530181.1 hypothetical protein [Microcoleus sp. PH2017_21_RUC_O_A]